MLIREVMEGKAQDASISLNVLTNRDNLIYLHGPCKSQLNGDIQAVYSERGRFEDLADPKYSEAGGIFDLMAYTVIQVHLLEGASQRGAQLQ